MVWTQVTSKALSYEIIWYLLGREVRVRHLEELGERFVVEGGELGRQLSLALGEIFRGYSAGGEIGTCFLKLTVDSVGVGCLAGFERRSCG